MSAQRKARKRAIDILFESQLRSADPVQTLADRRISDDRPVNPYTVALVDGVAAHRERIDELLATYAEGWSLDRMPPLDLTILRLGSFELLWVSEVPGAVVISEYVELAAELSTDASPPYINGVLARVWELKPLVSP
jgi:transcription antitermination protein NusB